MLLGKSISGRKMPHAIGIGSSRLRRSRLARRDFTAVDSNSESDIGTLLAANRRSWTMPAPKTKSATTDPTSHTIGQIRASLPVDSIAYVRNVIVAVLEAAGELMLGIDGSASMTRCARA